MNLKNIKERQPEQQLNSDSAADNKQVSPLAQNRLLSAALSVEEDNKLIAGFMGKKGRVLVACEYSGTVRDAFAAKGWDAWSCDILPTRTPGNHYEGNVMDIINEGWDLMIAHPPCTYLTITANRSFVNNPDRWEKRLEAIKFVYKLMNVPIEHIAIENPVGVISTHIRPAEQYIQPFQFGHPMSKKTGLWLKNLPALKATNIVEPEYIIDKTRGKKYSPLHYKTSSTNNPEAALLRSKTFDGIANAMAEQWTAFIVGSR